MAHQAARVREVLRSVAERWMALEAVSLGAEMAVLAVLVTIFKRGTLVSDDLDGEAGLVPLDGEAAR